MKNSHAILFFVFVFTFAAYSQVMIKKANENLPKSYPVDGTPLLYKQDQQVAQWIKAHPDYYSKIRMQKASAWGFTVGSTHSWQAYNFTNNQFYSVPSTCRGIGPHCYVFVEDASWNGKVNQAAVDSVVNEFENKTPANPNMGIYETDVNTFGNPPDVDNDPRIIILILDIKDGYNGTGGYTAGYFSSTNEIPTYGSNQAEIYYMDCNPTDLTTTDGLNTALETCAHEFQHMINWNYHQSTPEWTFVNEGLSMAAEIVCGYPPEFPELYAGESNFFLFGWRTNDNTLVLNDYSRAQRFFMYWLDQFGAGILKYIVQDNTNHGVVGAGGLSYALKDDGQSLTLTQVFNNWLIANELNNKSVNSAWGYTYPGLPNSVPKTFYNPNISKTDTIQNYAAEYLTFTNSNNLNITFSTSSSPVIKAIETGGTGSPRVVDVPLNSAFSDAAYGTTYNTISFVVIDTILTGASEVSALDNIVSYTSTGTITSNVTELKWDNTEPIGYLNLNSGDSVAVLFDALPGGILDSVRVGLRTTGSIIGGVWTYSLQSASLFQTKLAGPFTASISSTPPYPYPVPWPNWSGINLSSLNISTDQPIAVGFVIPSINNPKVMVTETPGNNFAHSLTYDVGTSSWTYYVDSTTATYQYLIRAYVSITTGVKQVVELTPKGYALSQNYPNPFNPSTVISYQLPIGSHVSFKVYNSLGELVATLHQGYQKAGIYQFNFNAAGLSSGVYFYRLQTEDFVQVKKMLLIK